MAARDIVDDCGTEAVAAVEVVVGLGTGGDNAGDGAGDVFAAAATVLASDGMEVTTEVEVVMDDAAAAVMVVVR